jgi:hypothetical protein
MRKFSEVIAHLSAGNTVRSQKYKPNDIILIHVAGRLYLLSTYTQLISVFTIKWQARIFTHFSYKISTVFLC